MPGIRHRVLGEVYPKDVDGSYETDSAKTVRKARDAAWADFVKEREAKRRRPCGRLGGLGMRQQKDVEPVTEIWPCHIHGSECDSPHEGRRASDGSS